MADEKDFEKAADESMAEIRQARVDVQRFTAYKIWIADVLQGTFVKQDGILPDYVRVKEKEVSRVNLIAAVVDNFSKDNYTSLTLDDGTGQIRLKAFGEDALLLNTFSIGDILLVFARVREFNSETYLTPEIVKKVDERYAQLRKLELTNEFGTREEIVYTKQFKQTVSKNSQLDLNKYGDDSSESSNETDGSTTTTQSKPNYKAQIMQLIQNFDEGEGVSLDELKKYVSHEILTSEIKNLLEEGDAYEPRPGKIKLI